MPPKITLVTKPDTAIPFVFFIKAQENISRHPLFKLLDGKEQTYLAGIAERLRLKEKESKFFIFPETGRAVIAVGAGTDKTLSAIKAGFAMRIAVQTAKKERVKKFALWAEARKTPQANISFYETVAVDILAAHFEFTKYKTPPEGGFRFIEDIQAIVAQKNKNIAEGLRRGEIIGEEVNACRELSNTPGGDMTPRLLAEHAEKISQGLGIKTTTLDEKKIRELGMGGIIGVSKGSAETPRFIILEYLAGPTTQKPTVFVGKGVTFDTGGLNLKPSDSIYEMHMDMSGGAAVIHAIRAAARLKLKKNIVGLIPAVENMPSGSSYRPGDVLRTMSGKTIEVLNTDAEGRVILADALLYAKKYNPSLVIDVATLTGAAMVALGQRYSALFSTDKKLENHLRRIGEETGDRVWPLPLSADYEEEIRGTFGDVANAGKTRYGGAITGAVFLWQFTKNDSASSTLGQNSEKAHLPNAQSGQATQAYPWAHLDIAPRMTTIEGEFLAKGAAGAAVRLLTRLIEEL